MAIIGTFTQQDDGGFVGTLQTLTVQCRLTFEPQKKRRDTPRSFLIRSGTAVIGTAWDLPEKNGRFLSVTLDHPSFAGPIHCRLVKTSAEHGFSLVWDRPKQDNAS